MSFIIAKYVNNHMDVEDLTSDVFIVESTFTVTSCICFDISSIPLLFVHIEYITINANTIIEGTINTVSFIHSIINNIAIIIIY